MELQCELISRGYDLKHLEDGSIPPEVLSEAQAEKGRWQLLFQIGATSGSTYEVLVGDCACLYFWVLREDLEQGQFERTWTILQY